MRRVWQDTHRQTVISQLYNDTNENLTPSMKLKYLLISSTLIFTALSSALAQRGMPQANRDTIHALLAAHDQIKREVKVTDDGYTATTTSEDPNVAATLQRHVGQMDARMKKGLMVRRWDPAYVEFVNHYDDMDITIKKIANGVQVIGKGKTEDAKKVLRNHAGIITKLVAHGMEEAHKEHAAVLSATADPATEEQAETPCCQAKENSNACCKEKGPKGKANCCAQDTKAKETKS